MKKVLLIITIIFFLLIAKGRTSENILEQIYISSYYLSYSDNTYKGVFYSNDSGLSENDEEVSSITSSVDGNTLVELFENVSKGIEQTCNYKHVKSVILDNNYLTDDLVNEYIEFIKNDYRFNTNAYIFTTNENINKIYKVGNNNKFVFNNPTYDSSLYNFCKPLSFVSFIRGFYNKENILIPMIKPIETWLSNDISISSIILDSVYIYNSNTILSSESHPFLYLLFSSPNYFVSENIVFNLVDYNVDIKVKDKLEVIVKTSYKASQKITYIQISEYISNKLNEIIKGLYLDNIDVLNLELINYRYNKNYRIDDVIVKVKINN